MSTELSRRSVLRRTAIGAGTGAVALAAPSVASMSLAPGFAAAASGPQTFTVELMGTGEPDSSGMIEVMLNPLTGEVCWTITQLDINDPNNEFTLLHIHVGPAGVDGPIIVPLTNTINGCVFGDIADVELICESPADFYVNLHTADAPAGAIRGQLA